MNSEQNQQQNFSLQICVTLSISIERESISKAIYIDADQEHWNNKSSANVSTNNNRCLKVAIENWTDILFAPTYFLQISFKWSLP